MESHVAGRIAAEANLPFAILRVICDPADPQPAAGGTAGMRRDGTTNIGAVLGAVFARRLSCWR